MRNHPLFQNGAARFDDSSIRGNSEDPPRIENVAALSSGAPEPTGTNNLTTAVNGLSAGSSLSAGSGVAVDSAVLSQLGLDSSAIAWGKLQAGLGNLFVEAELSVAGLSGAARASSLANFTSANSAAPVHSGYVVIDAAADDGNGAALLATLQGLGLLHGASSGALVGGMIPIDAIDDLASLANLRFARPAYAETHAGQVSNQADFSLHTDTLLDVAGLDGTGITIGVLSDSFDSLGTYGADIASGDLPADVNLLLDLPSGDGTDEGRAMLQLIHDIAPGASLAFNTAFIGGQAGFAQGITDLSGISQVIVDDISYFAEPFFEDGVIAQAVDTAVASGDVYFSSAANEADQSYEAAFVDSGETFTDIATGITYRLHDFDPGAGVDSTQTFYQSGNTVYSLQWDQPFYSVNPGAGGSTNDLAFIIRTTDGQVIVVQDDDNIGVDPIELLSLNGSGNATISIGVREDSADPGYFKYIAYGPPGWEATEFGSYSSTTAGHANAAGAIAVGAAAYFETPPYTDVPLAEYFTSKGGTLILFDGDGNRLMTPEIRDKVEITAPDGTNTTFFGSDAEGDGFPNFFGTSAAAPNAAALAVLLLQKYPTATPTQIEAALKASAIDITDSDGGIFTGLVGTDVFTGAGLIQAHEAITALGQILGVESSAPVGIDQTIVIPNNIYSITFADLYTDIDGNPLETLTIGTITTSMGSLFADGIEVTNGQIIQGGTIQNGGLVFVANTADEVVNVSFTFTLKDTGAEENTDTTPNTLNIIANLNDAPVIANLDGDAVPYTEDVNASVRIDAGLDALVSDSDSADFNGGSLTATISSGFVATRDRIGVFQDGVVSTAGGNVTVNGVLIGTLSPASITTGTQSFTLNFTTADATAANVQAVIRHIFYGNGSEDPSGGLREITLTFNDGDGTVSGGTDSVTVTTTVDVVAVDDAPGAVADSADVLENATVSIAVIANDTDVDGGTKAVATIAGMAVSAGGSVTLASGATATLNMDGTIGYDPNGAFDSLVSPATAMTTGASNSTATDSFSYALNGGSAATVTVTVTGVDSPGDQVGGDSGDNDIIGTDNGDLFNLSQGGTDAVSGGGGDDGFLFGGAFDAGDTVDGGAGALDQIGLQGDYSGGLTLAPGSMTGVEYIVLLPGDDARFGGETGTLLSYSITTDDANVAAGETLYFQANTLRAGESFTLDASSETDGTIFTYGGFGDDTIIGGQSTDAFYFGTGRFGAGDLVDGLLGSNDTLALQGDYSGANAVTFGAGQIFNIDILSLISSGDARFGGGAGIPYSYDIIMDDSNLLSGDRLTVSANTLHADEVLTFDGSAESDGFYTVYGGDGADTITGGQQGDLLYGRGGADMLTGGSGDDVFAYSSTADSNAAASDTILDFLSGSDRINLVAIDANTTTNGNQAFTFFGATETTTAGSLYYEDNLDGSYTLYGNTDSDGTADLVIHIVSPDPILTADIVL